MLKKSKLIAFILTAPLFLMGCSTALEKRNAEISLRYLDPATLIFDNYSATDVLIRQAAPRLIKDQPILVATVVQIDDLYTSSTFGRVTSENIASRFTQAGYKIVEMKLGNSIYMKRNQGELVLTREIQNIAKLHDAQAVVVGSYGVGTDSVMVNVKVVSPNEFNTVLASYDYSVRKVREIDAMLRSK